MLHLYLDSTMKCQMAKLWVSKSWKPGLKHKRAKKVNSVVCRDESPLIPLDARNKPLPQTYMYQVQGHTHLKKREILEKKGSSANAHLEITPVSSFLWRLTINIMFLGILCYKQLTNQDFPLSHLQIYPLAVLSSLTPPLISWSLFYIVYYSENKNHALNTIFEASALNFKIRCMPNCTV